MRNGRERIFRSVIPLASLGLLVLTGCQNKESQAPGPTEIEALLLDHGIPGLAVGYIEDCRTEETRVFGSVGRGMDKAVTRKTAFEAGSVTKPVFAHLVMTLVEDGSIDLDRPISETFVYPRIVDQDAYDLLTLRHILAHQSGLPNWAGNSGDANRDDPIASLALPGESFHYSGEAYWLAEQYVEATTDMSFDDLFDRSLKEHMPLSTPKNAPSPGAEMSVGRYKNGRTRRLSPRPTSNAAFSLQTVITDFADYVAFMCAGGDLKPETYAEMLTPVTRVKGDEYGGNPARMNGSIHYGLGWSILERDGRRVYFHGGTTGAYEAFAAFDPVSKTGYVMLANSGHGLDLVEELAPKSLGDLSSIEIWFN